MSDNAASELLSRLGQRDQPHTPSEKPFQAIVTEVRQNLTMPPIERRQYLSEETRNVLASVYGYDLDAQLLFPFAKSFLQKLQEKKGLALSSRGKVTALWDLVQSYDYRQGLTIEDSLQKREFDCVLRSMILGALIEDQLGDEAIVLGDNVGSHTQLLVIERASLTSEKIDASFVDPTLMRKEYMQERKDISTIAIRPIQDLSVLSMLREGAVDDVSPPYLVVKFAAGYDAKRTHSIRSYKDTVQAALWSNFGVFLAKSPEEKISYFRKALLFDPNFSVGWVNLGEVLPTREEKTICFRKALSLDPNNINALIGLGMLSESMQEQIEYFSQALERDPWNGKAFYGLGRVYLRMYETSGRKNMEALINARKYLKEARLALPELPGVLFYLGMAYKDFPRHKNGMDFVHVIEIWKWYIEIARSSASERQTGRLAIAEKQLERLDRLLERRNKW